MRRSVMAAVLVLVALAAGPAAAQQQAEGTGLLGTYYDNPDFEEVVEERLDPNIAFDWGREVPDGIPLTGEGDDFGVVWTGFVQPEFSQRYTFTTSSDDGVRLRIDGETVLENLTEHAQTEDSGTVTLEAGRLHEIELVYFDVGGEAIIFLAWESAGQPRQLVPTERLYPPDTVEAEPTPAATPAPPPPPAGPPDLAVVASGVSGATQAGSPLLFTATVVNQGDSPTPAGVPITVQFLSGPGELATAEHSAPIAPGELVNLTSTGAWTAQEGEFLVTAEVDEVDRIDEADEDNNSIPQNLVIAPAVAPVAAVAPDTGGPVRLAILALLVLGVVLLLANLVVMWRQRRPAATAGAAGEPGPHPARHGTTTVLPHAEPAEAVPTRRHPRD